MVLAVRPSSDQWLSPWSYYTSADVNEFFELLTNGTLNALAGRLEAWCIAGIDGKSSSIQCSDCPDPDY